MSLKSLRDSYSKTLERKHQISKSVNIRTHMHVSIVYPWAYSPLVSNAPHFLTIEFPGYWDWLSYLELLPVLVSIAFSPFAVHISVFLFTLHLPLNFIRVSSLRPT